MSGKGTEAFDGIAKQYANFRPSYPDELVAYTIGKITSVQSDAFGIVLDVGCGTGISTKQLRVTLPPQIALVGLEPGEDMLRTAISGIETCANLIFIKGQAEQLPFRDGIVRGIFVAQALQWFQRTEFYSEAARVLCRGGCLAIIQNNRNWKASSFLDAYEAYMENANVNYSRDYRSFDILAEMKESGLWSSVERNVTEWTRSVSREEFIGMAFSSTKINSIVKKAGSEQVRKDIIELMDRFENAATDEIRIPYETELFLGFSDK